jgi:HEAT repeat protein
MMPSTKQSHAATINRGELRVRSLLDGLASLDPVLREQARETLVVVGKRAVPSLIALLSHRKRHVRWEAAKTLCGIADPIAATALVNALDDSDGDVRWLAAEGLIALRGDGLYPLLAALLDRSQSSWLCEGAHHVCHALVKKNRLGPILRPVLAALERADRAIGAPLAAYTALSKLRELS